MVKVWGGVRIGWKGAMGEKRGKVYVILSTIKTDKRKYVKKQTKCSSQYIHNSRKTKNSLGKFINRKINKEAKAYQLEPKRTSCDVHNNIHESQNLYTGVSKGKFAVVHI